jgi:hypothetical protein
MLYYFLAKYGQFGKFFSAYLKQCGHMENICEKIYGRRKLKGIRKTWFGQALKELIWTTRGLLLK